MNLQQSDDNAFVPSGNEDFVQTGKCGKAGADVCGGGGMKLLNAGKTDATAPSVLLDAKRRFTFLKQRIALFENRV